MKIDMKIKKLREEQGLTQAALAKKAGLSREGIAYLETGKRSPTLITLKKLAKALKISVVDLLE